MAEQAARETIVVGVDGSPDSDLAVDWAVDLATRTQQPVHIVHVRTAPPRSLVDEDAGGRWARRAQQIVDDAVTHAGRTAGVAVTGSVVDGAGRAVVEALTRAGSEAAMLVVGAVGHGSYTGLLLGSVSQHAVRHGHCPVVTVRPTEREGEDRVVVGADYSEGAEKALALALELAAAQGAPVTVVHCWRAPSLHGAGVALPMPADTGQEIKREEERLAELLAPWQQKFPNVRVVGEVVPGHAASVLTDASHQAGLVVVGSRGRGAFAELLLGSVSQSVLNHARCPVAVAR